MDYGRYVIGNTGVPIEVAADGAPEWQPIGISVDWTTVTAVGSDTTLSPEGLTVKSGQKYLRYGQVMCKITGQPVNTVTLSGSPSAGTFTLYVVRPDNGAVMVTAAIAYNATATAVKNAITALNVGGYPVAVTGSAGGPYTVTTPLGISVASSNVTGGAAGSVVATANANYGWYGPYDTAASDGRQTVTPGEVCVLNTTVLQNGPLGLFSQFATNHPGAIVGGLVWKDRVLATSGTHSLAAGPTWTELLAALPRLALLEGA
jgi:hypothetical protein